MSSAPRFSESACSFSVSKDIISTGMFVNTKAEPWLAATKDPAVGMIKDTGVPVDFDWLGLYLYCILSYLG